MASPSLSQGVLMSSPGSDNWWALFLEMHGRDSEEDKAFTGYLSQHGIPAGSGADVLAQAYAEFRTFVDESYAREHTEGAEERQRREAVPVERPMVPRSSLSVPERQKPMTAATRPLDLRDEEAAAQPSPLQDPSAVQAATAPGDSAALDQAAGSTPSGATPQEAAQTDEGERERPYGQRRR
jgi:hypothetical protein